MLGAQRKGKIINMKVAVILGDNIHRAPYYYRYEKWLCDNHIDFDVIMWNREKVKENCKGNLIEFIMADEGNNKNPLKVFKFFAFSHFVKKTVKKNIYDKVIFLGLTGCAVTLEIAFFKKYYNRKYWLDIRDYHYEWFKPYYWLEKQAIDNAYFVALSSKGFERFLPKHAYGYIHNIDPNMKDICAKFAKTSSDRIRISFIGNVRYYNENVALINSLKNDDRFLLQYFGPGSKKIAEYCKDNNIENVHFEGPFKAEQTRGFYEKTDIINNVYGNTTLETLTALSNKLYYSIYLRLPIMVSPGTFMETVCKPYNIAVSYINCEDFADRLFEWYCFRIKSGADLDYQNLQREVEQEDIAVQERFVEFIAK